MAAHSRSACVTRRNSLRLHVGVVGAVVLAGCSTSGSLFSSGPGDDLPTVVAARETQPVERRGDAADDPAVLAAANGTVWIAGTDKQFGLRIYDLDGEQLHALETGRLNNVDAIATGDDTFLLSASNRTSLTIDLYDANLGANSVALRSAINLDFEEPYGLCMAKLDDTVGVFVGDKTGRVQHWSINGYDGVLVEEYRFASQTEGCVVDSASRTLFVGEEEHGIWAIDLDKGDRRLIDAIGAGQLTADVEGLDIYSDGDNQFLLASSQGDNSFVVYDLNDYSPLLHFRIADHAVERLDGVSETDGIAATSQSIPGFQQGVLVVQDGHNTRPRARQNFKIVDWAEIDKLLQNLP